MEFQNVGKFEEWLKSILKEGHDNYDLEAYLNDVETQWFSTGSHDYEVGRFYTKSGNPECYNFEIGENTIIF